MPRLGGHVCQCKHCGRSYTHVTIGIQTDKVSEMSSFVDFTEKMFKPGAPFNHEFIDRKIMMVRPKKLKGDTKDVDEPSSLSETTINEGPEITKKPNFDENFNLKEDTMKSSFSESSLMKDFELIKSQGFGFNSSSAFTEKFSEICETPKFQSSQNVAFNSKGRDEFVLFETLRSSARFKTFSKTQNFTVPKKLKNQKLTTHLFPEKSQAHTTKHTSTRFNFNQKAPKKTHNEKSLISDLSEDSNIIIPENYGNLINKHTFLDSKMRESFKNLVQLEKMGLKQQFAQKDFKFHEKRKSQVAENESLELSNSLDMDRVQDFLDN